MTITITLMWLFVLVQCGPELREPEYISNKCLENMCTCVRPEAYMIRSLKWWTYVLQVKIRLKFFNAAWLSIFFVSLPLGLGDKENWESTFCRLKFFLPEFNNILTCDIYICSEMHHCIFRLIIVYELSLLHFKWSLCHTQIGVHLGFKSNFLASIPTDLPNVFK